MQARWFLQRFVSFICGVILSGTLLGASLVNAATYYVATSGSDSNPGTSGSPFRTINRGVKALKPGDTLRVKSGTYAEALMNPLPSGLSASQPTTIEGDPAPNRPILRPTTSTYGAIIQFNQARSNIALRHLVIDGSNHTGRTLQTAIAAGSSGVAVNGLTVEYVEMIGRTYVSNTGAGMGVGNASSNVVVRHSSVHGWRSAETNPGAHGFYWSGSNGLIEHTEIYDNNGYGIQFYDGHKVPVNNNVFRNNYVHGNAKGGLYMATGTGNAAYNNIITNSIGRGIWVTGSGSNYAYNNTIYNNSVGILITNGIGAIRNNILYQNGTNISQSGGTPTLSHNLTTDPKFVNAASGNFRLQSSSPAINKGTTLSTVRTDFDGTPRPQGSAYDIGAFEYTSSTGTPAVSAPANLRMTNAK